jgi:hypothetical protein
MGRDPCLRKIAVGMSHRTNHWRKSDQFIHGEVKFDTRYCARPRLRIVHPPFATRAAARIRIEIEAKLLRWNPNAGLFIDPRGYVRKGGPQEIGIEMGCVRQRQIKIFGKAIRLGSSTS